MQHSLTPGCLGLANRYRARHERPRSPELEFEKPHRLHFQNTAPRGEDPALYISRQFILGAPARARGDGMAAIAPIALNRWFRPAFKKRDPVKPHRVETIMLANPAEGYARVCEALAEFHHRLASITVPALVIDGSHASGTPLACSEVVAGCIRNAQLVIIPDSAHVTNVERPAAFTTALVDFLQRAANISG